MVSWTYNILISNSARILETRVMADIIKLLGTYNNNVPTIEYNIVGVASTESDGKLGCKWSCATRTTIVQ